QGEEPAAQVCEIRDHSGGAEIPGTVRELPGEEQGPLALVAARRKGEIDGAGAVEARGGEPGRSEELGLEIVFVVRAARQLHHLRESAVGQIVIVKGPSRIVGREFEELLDESDRSAKQIDKFLPL